MNPFKEGIEILSRGIIKFPATQVSMLHKFYDRRNTIRQAIPRGKADKPIMCSYEAAA
jgi:hypothetical protein